MTTTSEYAEFLRTRVASSIATKQRLLDDDETFSLLGQMADVLVKCLQNGGCVFFCGNGGSSTDAQHLSAELLGRFYRDRGALPSVNLSDNTAAVTAIGNDYSYEEIFSRQIQGLGRPGDVIIGMSTSGNSKNVVKALEVAGQQGLTTIALVGQGGGKLAGVAHHVFRAPSDDTPRIQECHMLVGHTLCEIIENELYPQDVA